MEIETTVQAQSPVGQYQFILPQDYVYRWGNFLRLGGSCFPDVDPFMDYVQHFTPPDAIPTPELKSQAGFLL